MAIFFIIVCIVGIIILPYWIIPANPFPKPSGEWNVGTSDLIWDSLSHNGIIAKISSAGALITDGTQVKFNPIEPEVFADIDLFESVAAPLMVEQASNMSMILSKIIALNSSIDSYQ